MEILKNCRICQQNILKYNCKFCGKGVCENCYDKDKGLCIDCSQKTS